MQRGNKVCAVEFRILGPLEVVDGGQRIELDRAKLRTLLAALLLHPNQVVSADRLAEALWGETLPRSATNTLQGYISHLRRALSAVESALEPSVSVRTQARGYLLAVDPERIDAFRFERLAKEGHQSLADSQPGRAAKALAEGLDLWRGPALADLASAPFACSDAARLEELRLVAIEDLAEAELALGRHGQLVGRLRALVERHPLRERLWGQLMVALYRCGRQAEALRAYSEARLRLAEELGLDPGPALRRLEAEILAQAPALNWDGAAHQGEARHRALPFPGPLSAGTAIDYVGRAELLARLDAARREAAAGTCRTVLLAGEPGVGKTRTAAEVARAAHDDGAVVLYGRCDEDVAVPYQPFVEALDWYTTHAADPFLGRHPGELSRLAPLLHERVPGLPAPVSSDPRTEEYLLFEATASWLAELARRQPLVLVLDDLHWAAKPVLVLLRHVLRAALGDQHDVALVVIGTYRDSEVHAGHPLADALADLRRLATFERWTVNSLSGTEAEHFVCRVLACDPDAGVRRLAESLHAATEGNPFFIAEVLRYLVDAGTVRRSGGCWAVPERVMVAVPESVREVVGQRLARLGRPTVEVVTAAAVLGQDFDVEVLAAITDVAEDTLLDALDEAMAARLVHETGAERYRFAHALVRAALTDRLSTTRSCRLHRRAAEAVEQLRPDDVVALAYHYTEACAASADVGAAARYGLAAAEQALAARALAEAESQFRRTLDLLDRGRDLQPDARARILCGLGEAQRDQGNPEFRATLLEAARLARAVGDVEVLVRAALSNSRGVPSVIGALDPERVAVTEEALAAVGPEPSANRARLLAQLAAEICFGGDDRRRLALADEAEAMARSLGDSALVAWVLNRTGYAAFAPGRVERLVTRGEEATRLSDRTGDPAQRVLSRYFWSGALLSAGDVPGFRRVTEDMLAAAAQAPPTLKWLATATQARLRLLDGDAIGVHRVADEAFALAQELCEPDGPAWWTATLAPLAWHRGALAELLDALRTGTEQYPGERAWRLGYVLSLALAGRHSEARALLDADPPRPPELLDHVFPFFNAHMVAFIAFELDDARLAAETADALRPYLRSWAHQYANTLGPVSFAVAVCAAASGDVDDAVTMFEATEEDLMRYGCAGVLPHFRSYYAQVLLRRGSREDRSRAGALLHEVRRGAADLDAPALVSRADHIAGPLRSTALGSPRRQG